MEVVMKVLLSRRLNSFSLKRHETNLNFPTPATDASQLCYRKLPGLAVYRTAKSYLFIYFLSSYERSPGLNMQPNIIPNSNI